MNVMKQNFYLNLISLSLILINLFKDLKEKTAILLLLFGLNQIAYGQQIAFNRQYSANKLAFNSIKTVHDGGCIVVGGDFLGPNGGNYFYLKTDMSGNEIWRATGTYFTGSQDSSNTLHDVIETADHNFLMCGELTTYSPYMTHNLILCVDSLGGILWRKLETNPYPISAYHLVKNNSGEFYTVGSIQDSISKLYIEKYTANGDTIWTKKISFYPNQVSGHSIETKGGFLYASGQIFDTLTPGLSWPFLTKLDTAGNVIANVNLVDSTSISSRNLCVFDSTIYLPTIKSHYNGPTSWIAVYDTALNQIYSFDYPTMEACEFNDENHFLGAYSGITFYKGQTSGDSIWSFYINEVDGGIRSISFDSIGCGYACGAISDGVTSVGLIVKICDSLSTSISGNLNFQEENNVIIYPNPSGRIVTIRIPEKFSKMDSFLFTLYDDSNRPVFSRRNILTGETVIDLANLPSTIYHYSLINKDTYLTGKIILN